MYRVLMPVDTDPDRARAQARYVAALPASAEAIEAVVLFVFDGSARDADVPEEIAEFAGDPTRITAVRRAVEYLDERGVATEVIEGSADAAERILAEAEERDVDSVVMGGRKRSPIEQSLFGSVTQSVVRNTDRPVVVTGGSTA